jgi:hypothetical protein
MALLRGFELKNIAVKWLLLDLGIVRDCAAPGCIPVVCALWGKDILYWTTVATDGARCWHWHKNPGGDSWVLGLNVGYWRETPWQELLTAEQWELLHSKVAELLR